MAFMFSRKTTPKAQVRRPLRRAGADGMPRDAQSLSSHRTPEMISMTNCNAGGGEMRTRPFAPCEDAGDRGYVSPGESWGGAGRPFGNGPEQSQSRKAPIISTAKALKDEVFPPIKFIVKSYLVEGATILAGRPKIGKSWLALDWSIAVARGGVCFGDVQCKEGDVLYIALEDNKRRLKSRLAKLLGLIGEWPEKLEYATEWPRAHEGGLNSIRACI